MEQLARTSQSFSSVRNIVMRISFLALFPLSVVGCWSCKISRVDDPKVGKHLVQRYLSEVLKVKDVERKRKSSNVSRRSCDKQSRHFPTCSVLDISSGGMVKTFIAPSLVFKEATKNGIKLH